MQQASKYLLVGGAIAASVCFGGCKSDDDGGGTAGSAGTASAGVGGAAGAAGSAGGGVGGAAGTDGGGTGGTSGGSGGASGTTGGSGGASGTAGGVGGAGGMTGGSGGMSGGVGGAGGGGGMGGMTGGMGGSGDAATFTDVYDIIEMKCGGGMFGCHVMGTSGMLEMHDQEQAYMNLVGVDAQNCPGETRVVAGDADASLIIKALMGEACSEVDQMPRGRDPLSADEIATIREWIEAGALNN